MSKVVIAMSGGVDSSTAAALLVRQGHQVTGLMLRLWSEPGLEDSNRCCSPDAMQLARRAAAQLDIPFYVLDAREPFRSQVVQFFLDEYAAGRTPNPCLECNRRIRWGLLLDHARDLGADFLATGHYARLQEAPDGRTLQLLRACDRSKDQSYVLYSLNQEQLAHTLFPLGGLQKSEVRSLAQGFGLPSARRADSQDLCFLAGGDYRAFLRRNAPGSMIPGPIRTRDGRTLGEHRGLADYTIGQRKGLGLALGQPLYVLEKQVEEHVLIVGPLSELGASELVARQVTWIEGRTPCQPFRAEVKTRYTARPAWAEVTPLGEATAAVKLDQPGRDVTPGQAVVFYDGERVLGGGLIRELRIADNGIILQRSQLEEP
jgi:tRNA-specific 2-thiouridylase